MRLTSCFESSSSRQGGKTGEPQLSTLRCPTVAIGHDNVNGNLKQYELSMPQCPSIWFSSPSLRALCCWLIYLIFLPLTVYGQETPEKVPTSKSRNVIFILSDDHRYDFMGFMNTPEFLETPNLDRLAEEGAHLQNAFVTTSLCSPSRASILTGMYPSKHGVVDNDSPMKEGNTFFPQHLQKAGYETAFVGKWHMGHHHDDPRPGFDHWVSFRGQGVYNDPELNIDGERIQRKGYISDLLTDYAADWIKKPREKPFFLYLSHKAVHAEFQPAERHQGKYENAELTYPPSMADTEENYRGKPRWVKEQRDSWHGVDYLYHGDMDFDTFYRRYCESLLGVDESVGRILQTLEEQGLLQSTLVIYMGDNGFCFGEHGLIDKRHAYEPSMRVPMLAFCPEVIKQRTKIEKMVLNVDIGPTVLDAAGVATPETMDGSSFLPLLSGKDIPWRDEFYYVYYWERPFPHTPTMFALRTDRYKYITYHGIWDTDELYDLENDPREMQNLINDPQQAELIKEYRKKIFDWQVDNAGDRIPIRRSGLWQAADRGKEVGEE